MTQYLRYPHVTRDLITIVNVAGQDEALEWGRFAVAAHQRAIEVRPFEERDIDELLAEDAARELWSAYRP